MTLLSLKNKHLIEVLCDEILINYLINEELLSNWRVDLSDDYTSLNAIIEEDVVLTIGEIPIAYDKVEAFIDRVLKLSEETYQDFKVIILELLIHIMDMSYIIKIELFNQKLHHFLIDKLLELLTDSEPDISRLNKPSTINQIFRMVLIFLELGCEVYHFRKLITFLFNSERSSRNSKKVHSSASKFIILELLHRLFTRYPSHFRFALFNKITSFPFVNENLKKKFTIQTWFKINNLSPSNDEPVSLFILTNSNASDLDQTTFKIQLINSQKVSIEIKNHKTKSRTQFTFNQILQIGARSSETADSNNQGYIHLALTYDTSSNLNLFLNGEYSESIPCPEIHKVFSTWNKLYIGNEPSESTNFGNAQISDEILIKNLTILNTNLSHEWINLLYNLGLGYDWDFKDFTTENLVNLLHHLSPRGLFNVATKINELKIRKKDPTNSNDSIGASNVSKSSSGHFTLGRSGVNSSESTNLLDKQRIADSLSKLKQETVLFDTNEFFNGLNEQYKSDRSFAVSAFKYHNSISIHGALYGVGGTSLVLRLIEASLEIQDGRIRDSTIYKSFSLLFTLLNNSWRLAKEFENINGYGLLSILLTNYKQNYNPSLKLSLLDGKEDIIKKGEESPNNLLSLILSFGGYDFLNPYESIIINSFPYRFLLLNFDLFHESPSFEYLLYHFQILIHGSRYQKFNRIELSKMKLLRKLVQFLKSPSLLLTPLSAPALGQLASTITSIIKSDTSVETIKSISLYVIYAIYNPDCSTDLGVRLLYVLTDILCDNNSSIKTLKKFSRSITIHWILLLLNCTSKKVVTCGIKLLSKLLKILGPHIIKRFFEVNHGLDILTHYLRVWWEDEKILCLLYLSSFGNDKIDDVNLDEVDLISIQSNHNSTQLVLPEFLILMNNIVLNSLYTLSLKSGRLLGSNPSSPRKSEQEQEDLTLSMNVLHLLNKYIDSIKKGFEASGTLRQFYLSKEFLDGIFELLGHLKLSTTWGLKLNRNFVEVTLKLIRVLSDLFIENFINDTFMSSFENLNASTRVLILDSIFPRIFEHINQFVNVSNFIFNEKRFIDSTVSLSIYYLQELIKKNYFLSHEDLDIYITCICSLMEVAGEHSGIRKIKRELGGLIILKFVKLDEEIKKNLKDVDDQERAFRLVQSISDELAQELSSGSNNKELTPERPKTPDGSTFKKTPDSFNTSLKFLLYRQVTILQKDVMDDRKLSELIILILGMFLRSPHDVQLQDMEHVFNFLRTCYLMRQDDFQHVIKFLDLGEDTGLVFEFFQLLVSRNDEESFQKLTKYSRIPRELIKNSNKLVARFHDLTYLHVKDMLGVTLHNGGMLGQLNNIYIKSFEKDCELLKSSIIQGELTKFNRAIQDLQENAQFFISNYNLLKNDVSRLLHGGIKHKNYMLDYIENHDRMRKRLIVEDQIPDSEKLSYNINIPIKKFHELDENLSGLNYYDEVISSNGIDTLSLSSADGLDGDVSLLEDEGFEIIDGTLGSSYEDKNRKVIRSLFMGDQISALWNISQINGLVPVESLMILGTSHLYLIENYFHCNDGNVIDVQDAPVELRDPILHLINSQSSNILKNDVRSHRNKSWSLGKLSSISKRQFLLRDIAIEMFFSDGASILITCLSTKERDAIYNKLYHYVSGKGLDYDLSQVLQSSSSMLNNNSFSLTKLASAFSSQSSSVSSASSTSSFVLATKKWKMGEMSNFYYLMIINTLAGRTFNDLTQYPIFPWVIADYTSETLDLSNPKIFRDLSKPMGAQTPNRANQFKERFDALASLNDHEAPPFHYGTHYSSAMIVTSFLIRLRPFVQSYLLLQGGKFDHADRLFNSVLKAWNSASRDNTTDVRELTPEFFYLPEFLVNTNNFEFGLTQNGDAPNNVELPPWAHNDPKIFIAKNREALESSYVSANLHLWIDLIFGFKQNGPEAEKSLNVFHHLSYNGAINLDNVNDDLERRAIIGMINNFGQTPKQLFNNPHPMKEVLNLPNYYLTTLSERCVTPKLLFESKLNLPIEKLEISAKIGRKWIGRPSCISSEDDLLIRKANKFKYDSGSLIINQTTFLNIHLSNITAIAPIGHKTFLTGSEDGIINVWKCNTRPHISLQFQSVLRGHISPITALKFSKSFKIGVSVDLDNLVFVWDLTRFKFIRRLTPPEGIVKSAIASISNDTGNIGIVYRMKDHNQLQIYTVNGELILDTEFGDQTITSFCFGSINDPMVDTGNNLTLNNHAYWSNEVIAVAMSKTIQVFELTPLLDSDWRLICIDSLDYTNVLGGGISVMQLFKYTEVDPEDKLVRGILKIVIGDSTGKVYSI
ncbi:beach-domain-containing protein [Suhomyces tanzawaensis NRRL Y-17324]|uniref:Beach-domain-containing protein n=1 Tax=Suhomyces tanzawaensis NRRL Y-17324 TaxID=984487 RepID=A0A1E4SNF8_9ASCO|nr:beach-domain-containing protein [Suhomyces tanzawaensis NRRL Y-17324]ODV81035.1 beach-domain-containing protein [Suhomyces tanzawaensis NRRL Y-17324]